MSDEIVATGIFGAFVCGVLIGLLLSISLLGLARWLDNKFDPRKDKF